MNTGLAIFTSNGIFHVTGGISRISVLVFSGGGGGPIGQQADGYS